MRENNTQVVLRSTTQCLSDEKYQMNALVYYRMSTEQQSDSIAKQMAEIAPVIESHGYSVVRIYQDDGLSGLERSNRPGFTQMITDIESDNVAGASVLLVWKTSRFSREFPFAAMTFYNVVHRAGLLIHCTKLGRLSLDDPAARFQLYFSAEQNHAFSVELGENSSGGRRALAASGWWVTGNVPYGYDRVFVSPDGSEIRGSRLGGVRKPTGYHVRLRANAVEAKRVRSAFKLRASGLTLRGIADKFNRNGWEAPSGRAGCRWTHSNFIDLLSNPVYLGCVVVGRGGRNANKATRFSTVGRLVVESDKVEAIVDRELFTQVQ